MKNHLIWLVFILNLAASAADDIASARQLPAYPLPAETPAAVLITDATVWTMEKDGALTESDILLVDGRIAAIGKDLSPPKNALVIDGKGKHVTPGLIDAHSHSAVEGFGVNEGTNIVTAEVRVEDVLDPRDDQIYLQLSGGLTAANVLHGSANAIGGQNAVIKLRWGATRARDLLIEDAPPGIKFALGENPKRSAFANLPMIPRRYPQTRMGVEATIRNTFQKALEYQASWKAYNGLPEKQKEATAPPRRDLQLEAIVEIIEGRRLVHSHGYRADEFLALLRLMEEHGVKIATFQHILEGYKIADEMAAHGVGGSTFSDWWSYKIEAYDAIPYNAALMHERGVLVSLNSDNGNLARRMNVEAAKAIGYGGVQPEDALAMVTINPAIQLGIDHRTGSLKEGKDADVVIWNGDPLSVFSSVTHTFVDGALRFSRERDQAHRAAVETARQTLIDAILEKKKDEKEDEGEAEEDGESEPGDVPPTEESEDQEPPETEESEQNQPLKPAPAQSYQYAAPVEPGPFAIVGATIHPMVGNPIPQGVVIVQDGKIAAVGAAGTPVPEEIAKVEAEGKHLWPGIIHAQTTLGLEGIGSVAGTIDTAEMGDWNTDIHAYLAVHPESTHIPVARSAGITHALTLPTGGKLTGTGSLIRTLGWTWEEMAGSRQVVMGLNWPEGRLSGFAAFFGSPKDYSDRKKDAEKAIEELTEFFDNAELYHKAKAHAGDLSWESDPRLENMKPVLEGSLPLYIFVQEAWAIRQAVEWVKARGLTCVIVGGMESGTIADFLAENKAPVILTDVLNDPGREDQPYDIAYTTPAKLAQAGVPFAIAGMGSLSSAAHIRNIVEHAGFAAAFGLDREEAYRSISLYPARILGLDGQLGSIEVGKSASLVLTNGDLLEVSTVVEQVWIDGIWADMNDKHKRLYERYRKRPQPKAPN